jgi:hypothetical protein
VTQHVVEIDVDRGNDDSGRRSSGESILEKCTGAILERA